MRPDLKKKKDKSILAYVRELDELHKISWNAPLIKLAKPYQNGWTKYFALRDDYTRRADAKAHFDILAEIGGEAFCRKVDFVDRHGKSYGPGLRIIGKNEWEALGWPEHYKKYFSFGIYYENNYNFRSYKEGYKFVRPFCFVEQIRPHFVTHTRTIYPDVESRKQKLRNKFDQERWWDRFNKLKGRRRGSYDYRGAKARYLQAIGTKEMEEYDKS